MGAYGKGGAKKGIASRGWAREPGARGERGGPEALSRTGTAVGRKELARHTIIGLSLFIQLIDLTRGTVRPCLLRGLISLTRARVERSAREQWMREVQRRGCVEEPSLPTSLARERPRELRRKHLTSVMLGGIKRTLRFALITFVFALIVIHKLETERGAQRARTVGATQHTKRKRKRTSNGMDPRHHSRSALTRPCPRQPSARRTAQMPS